MSTMHSTGVVEGPSAKKTPQIILFYNSAKGAVDAIDKLTYAYTVKR